MSANTPTVPEVPAVPQGPQNQSGFSVPPAGTPPALPGVPPQQSHQYPGQKPGYVTPQPKEPEQPQQQQQAKLPEGLDLAAILQAALGQPAQTQPQQAPGWVPENVNTFDVDSIEDPIIKSMASVLKVAGAGMDLNRVLGNALAHGDPNLVDVAYIAEKGGANAAQIAEIAKGIVQSIEAKSNAIMGEVHAMAGGEANWAQSAAVFNQSAPPELRMVVARMLDSTQSAQIKAGAKIVTEFGRASGQLPQPGAALLNGASVLRGSGMGLSAAEFKAEHNKLNPQAPGFKEAREDLFRRRSMGKAAGL